MVIRINKVYTLIFQKNGNRNSFQKITLKLYLLASELCTFLEIRRSRNQTGFLVGFMHSEKLGQKIGGFMAEL